MRISRKCQGNSRGFDHSTRHRCTTGRHGVESRRRRLGPAERDRLCGRAKSLLPATRVNRSRRFEIVRPSPSLPRRPKRSRVQVRVRARPCMRASFIVSDGYLLDLIVVVPVDLAPRSLPLRHKAVLTTSYDLRLVSSHHLFDFASDRCRVATWLFSASIRVASAFCGPVSVFCGRLQERRHPAVHSPASRPFPRPSTRPKAATTTTATTFWFERRSIKTENAY